MIVTGIVIIGRNEGDRLKQCLLSIPANLPTVYVDSDSHDLSVALAQEKGIETVKLSPTKAILNAASARNAGAFHLIERWPKLKYVQFIDGDCELQPEWLPTAEHILDTNDHIAAVCGRRREKYPKRSIYNQLCDIEWDTPVGIVKEIGGDSLMRLAPFLQVGGFDPHFAGGEEPELCYRLRQNGWQLWRIPAEMTAHDAALTHFRQWWQRSIRCGTAYAQSMFQHNGKPERFKQQESLSIWLHTTIIPFIIVFLSTIIHKRFFLLLPLFYIIRWIKITRNLIQAKAIIPPPLARVYSFFILLGKFPQLIGQVRFFLTRHSQPVSYK